MTVEVASLPDTTAARLLGRSAEHRFYVGFTAVMGAALLFGFARTFFLRAWFPEWAQLHGAPEPFFLFHGALFSLWFLLLIVQPSLVAAGRVDLHRRLGRYGAGLAVVMIVVGIIGPLIAARRPGGFIDVPMSPLQFLTIPWVGLALFATFVTLAIVKRGDPQSHKRYMLIATFGILDAAVVRWPFDNMMAPLPIPGFDVSNLVLDLFLVPMIVWDFVSRGRLHPVTLWGGLAVIVSQPLRMMLGETSAWLAFAGWAVGLLGP
jgi:hypothetical protein